ncbi:MAG: FAD-dependent oxidoreductase [Solirubrobacterales bacterium]|nr:FAD-dependent oxidoreductase [Solirubrobacterales bacterium]
MRDPDYDVIVVGGGAPGEHCTGALAARGHRVAVVERELVGGECSYWACIPSKSLLRPGEAVQEARDAGGGPRSTFKRRWRGVTTWFPTIPMPARSNGWRTGASTCCAARVAWLAREWSRSTASGIPPSTSSWRPARIRSSRRSPGSASSRACGAAARRLAWRPSPAGCWYLVVGRQALSWRKSCAVSAAKRYSSRALTGCFPASRRRWEMGSARPCAKTESS